MNMKLEVFNSIHEISPASWEKIEPASFPFADYQFLLALEQNDCLGRRTGWIPYYVTCWADAELLGAIIVFSKTNSYGEYIFDFAWAQAHESHGIPYYPKFVAAIPFTPATGPKILLSADLTADHREPVIALLFRGLLELSRENKTSSLHALFIPEREIEIFQNQGFFIRHSFQYHWLNQNYPNFETFTQQLRAKRRKEIVRERKQAQQTGVTIRRITGDALLPEHAEWMFNFYLNTVNKMGGYPYLTQSFFRQIFLTLKDKILFVVAEDAEGQPLAGALNYFSGQTLFGRHWGCVEDFRSLHFEICYYQGIEFAIEKKLQLFEAGAQGEHKFNRGFIPRLTYSAHTIEHLQLQKAIQQFTEAEKQNLQHLFNDYAEQTPFARV